MLLYAADPMCSWCWGFAPVLRALLDSLGDPPVRYVMGGLAPDSDAPMDAATRGYVQQAWRSVEGATGAAFNWDFWSRCEPRRSTYPACRAVLAAESQLPGAGVRMFGAIQRAYYLEARNPSDRATLVDLARSEGLDAERFAQDLGSAAVEAGLRADLATCQRLGVGGFPTLLWVTGESTQELCRGFATLAEVQVRLAAARPPVSAEGRLSEGGPD